MRRDATIQTHVTQETKERLAQLAAGDNRTLSSYAARIFENHLGEKPEVTGLVESTGDTGYTYFIRSGKHYKVGRARNVEQRIAALCLPERPEIVAVALCDDYGRLEMALHVLLAHKRVNGEWFLLDNEDADAVKHLLLSRHAENAGGNVVAMNRK